MPSPFPSAHCLDDRTEATTMGMETDYGNVTEDPDLLTEIFLRLPLESLRPMRSVCKLWNSVLQEPEFARQHLLKHRSSSDSKLALVWEHGSTYRTLTSSPNPLYALGFESWHKTAAPLHKEFVGGGRLHSQFSVVASADGLLLITRDESQQQLIPPDYMGHCRDFRYYIGNPLTRRWSSLLPSPFRLRTEIYTPGGASEGVLSRTIASNSYGLGWDAVSRAYKLVHFQCLRLICRDYRKRTLNVPPRCAVLALGRRGRRRRRPRQIDRADEDDDDDDDDLVWREVKAPPHAPLADEILPVSYHESLYWIAEKHIADEKDYLGFCVLKMDLGNEEFQVIPLPETDHAITNYHLLEIKQQLCLVNWFSPSEMTIHALEKKRNGWEKGYVVYLDCPVYSPHRDCVSPLFAAEREGKTVLVVRSQLRYKEGLFFCELTQKQGRGQCIKESHVLFSVFSAFVHTHSWILWE